MTNTNGIVILTPDELHPNAGQDYDWFDSLTGVYGKVDTVNGTTSADSMPTQTIKLRLPQGYKGAVRVFYEVDDWGKVVVKNLSNNSEITLIDMDYKEELAGVRNGHPIWSKTGYWKLRENSDYEIVISQTNANYPVGYNPRNNIVYAKFEITLEKWPSNERIQSLNVNFDTPQTSEVDVANDKGNTTTRCASGHVYTGTLTVNYTNGSSANLAVQSGGWMDVDSPWTKSAVWEAPNASQADANPFSFPDTCIPAGTFRMETSERGKLTGFYFLDEDFANLPDELQHRVSMKLHVKERYGSSGCISTPNSFEWNRLRDAVANTGKYMESQGNNNPTISVPVSYGSACSVNYQRGLIAK